MADLLSTPPLPKQENAVPRDWRTVSAGELVDNQVLRYVDLDTPVETACQVCRMFALLVPVKPIGLSGLEGG